MCPPYSCNKIPSYGVVGSTTKEFCALHAEEGMVDLRSKKYGRPGCCIKHARYCLEGSTTREFCALHEEEGMDSVANSRCVEPVCNNINKHPT